MLFPQRATQQWIEHVEDSILQRVRDRQAKRAADLEAARARKPRGMRVNTFILDEYSRDATWSTSNIPSMPTMLIKGEEVPAALYGYLAHENNACLPENGTADEIKDGILAVLEESAYEVTRRVTACLAEYEITILTVEVDLLDKRITMHCLAHKPVMQINTIMGNRKVRQAMPPRARVCVNTFVEENRRTDDYLKNRPEKQEISREFFYEDGTIVRDEPQHWSAGMKHEPGDIIRIGSIAHRVEEERANAMQAQYAFDGDPIAGRDERRRLQAGTPFQPGERASWHAARNR